MNKESKRPAICPLVKWTQIPGCRMVPCIREIIIYSSPTRTPVLVHDSQCFKTVKENTDAGYNFGVDFLLLSATCVLLPYCPWFAAFFNGPSVLLQFSPQLRRGKVALIFFFFFKKRNKSKLVLKVELLSRKATSQDLYGNCLLGLPRAPNFIFTLFEKISLIKVFHIFL